MGTFMARMVFSQEVKAGEEIFRMGDRGRNAYIIENGKVEVSILRDGKKFIVAELGAGEIFGEMSMIDDAPRSATVTALEDTEVVVIQRSRFQRPLTATDPLTNMLLRVVLTRFRDAQRQLSGIRPNTDEVDPAMEEIRKLAIERIKIEKDMRMGLDAGEFAMHYQPIVEMTGGYIAGFEALMRWRKPDGENISPVVFIPLAEETGFIVELGRWSLERAISDQRRFVECFRSFFPDLPMPFMSINVSGFQLSDFGEIDLLAKIIKDSGVDPSIIKLEMTETLLVEDPEHAVGALKKIKELGVSIAIDDFGTGYSSLSYLHQFPLDTLKIDGIFVNNMDKSESSRRIVTSIVQLALSLEMDIVAEGIEEKPQMDALRALGCQYGQGFLMAKPASADDILALIETRPNW